MYLFSYVYIYFKFVYIYICHFNYNIYLDQMVMYLNIVCTYIHIFIYIYIYVCITLPDIYIYIHIFVFVYLCVYIRVRAFVCVIQITYNHHVPQHVPMAPFQAYFGTWTFEEAFRRTQRPVTIVISSNFSRKLPACAAQRKTGLEWYRTEAFFRPDLYLVPTSF